MAERKAPQIGEFMTGGSFPGGLVKRSETKPEPPVRYGAPASAPLSVIAARVDDLARQIRAKQRRAP